MKKVFAFAGIVVFMGLLFVPHLHTHLEFGGPGQVLWNDKECFIFLQTNHQGWRFTPIQYLKGTIVELLGGYFRFTDWDSGVDVYHIHSGNVDHHRLAHFELGTTVLPYQGRLYLMYYTRSLDERNRAEEPRNFVWNGDAFAPIGQGEARGVRASFQHVEDSLRAQGWSSKSFNANFAPWTVEVSQPDGTYTVELKRSSGGTPSAMVVLRGPAGDQTLVEWGPSEPHFISRGAYNSIFRRGD